MSGGQSCPILIVEDDLLIAADMKAALEESEYRNVEIARTPDEAMQRSRLTRPVIALIDIELPGSRDGVALATELFQEMGTRTIFVTGHSDPTTIARARSANPISWLKKPFGPGSIRAAVDLGLKSLDTSSTG
jgi:two-component system, response regulator PdtaR